MKLITIYPHLKDGPHSNIKFINFFESGKNRALETLELILIISSKLYSPSNHKFPLIKIKYWKKLLDNKIKISNNSNKSTWLNIFPKKKRKDLCVFKIVLFWSFLLVAPFNGWQNDLKCAPTYRLKIVGLHNL